MTDVPEWQKEAEIMIEPATGERAELLRQMSDAAFALIKVIELDLSGIRDGNGYYDAVREIVERYERLKMACIITYAIACAKGEQCPHHPAPKARPTRLKARPTRRR